MVGTDPDGALLDHAQDKIVVIDADGTFTYLNRATERILGYDPEALVGENAFDYIHPDDVDRVRATFERTVAAEDEVVETSIEYRHRASDGSWVQLESRFSNRAVPEMGGYVVSSHDVSDRVEAERERDETEARLREIAAKTADVLWMFSADWDELLFLNDAFERVYGGSVGGVEADPRAFLDAVHPDDRPGVEEAMARLSAGESVDIEYRVNPEQNFNQWVWAQGEPIVDDGEVVRVVGFSRDITDRRRRERQLSVLDNILRHNLRNDLNTVLGQADLIAENPDEAATERTAVIREVGEDLLQTAEKQRETIELLTGPTGSETLELGTLVDHVVADARDRFPGADIQTVLPETLRGCALPEVEVALSELVENAVKHSGSDRPSVRITGAYRGDEVAVSVHDDCSPLPEYEYRVLTGDHEMDDIYHSSGLGLWLVYWVADLSGGSVDFSSGDSGNTVTLVLPRPSGSTSAY
ncbi:PAS domain-containing sensor histidine kinase [Halostella litorea]|uniref:PAS domain-containing sensor histidine kinase n=1 Tax=Halostella litorea TaxID=2528831 RepID=UPI00109288A2|nr:PAS domain-containing sensor histidine kinase [Halostella litorea]